MKPVLLAGLRSNTRRWGALALVIALAVGFLTASLGVGDLMVNRGVKQVDEDTKGASVVLHEFQSGQATVDAQKAVAASGAESFSPAQGFWSLKTGDSSSMLITTGVRPAPFGPQRVLEGRVPSSEREIALDRHFVQEKGLKIGDTVTVSVLGSTSSKDVPMTIVGTVPDTGSTEWATGVVAQSLVAGGSGALPTMILVAGAEPSQFGTLKGATVTSREAMLADARNNESQRSSVLPFLLFSVIALVVSVLVISTTMSVLTARRVKELALFRLIGAKKSAITTAILLEAAILGGLSALIGLGLGVATLAVAVRLLPGFSEISFIPSPLNLAGAWLMGVVATLLGSLPALSLARGVRPLQAVSQDISQLETTRGRTFGRVVALIIFLAATIGIWVFAQQNKVGVALLLGVASACAAIPVFTWFAPAIASRVPRILSRSTAARLASANIASSPRRAGSTSTALLIGITLVTMLLTAVSTSRVAALAGIEHDSPFDVQIQLVDNEAMQRAWEKKPQGASDSWMPPVSHLEVSHNQLERLRAIPGVTAAEILTPVWQGPEKSVDGRPLPGPVLYALPEDVSSIARGDLPYLKDRQVFGEGRIDVGLGYQTLPETIRGTRGSVTLEPGMTTHYPSSTMVVTAATAKEFGAMSLPNEPKVLVMKLDDTVTLDSYERITGQVNGVLDTSLPGMGGGAIERLMTISMLDVLLKIALALLGMSVLIAVIGVSDSLALSQLERTREVSLLRALGMSRRGVGAIITWESVGLTLSALLVGIPLGIYYGWTGSLAVTPVDTIAGSTPSVDPILLGAMVLGGLLLAIASSVIPARRSQRITPSEGLAQE